MKPYLLTTIFSFLIIGSSMEGAVDVNSGETLSNALQTLAKGDDSQINITSSFSYDQLPFPLNASFPGGTSGATTYLDSEGFNLLINGNGNTLTQSGNTRGFFARGGGGGSVTIQNLTINRAIAQGGNGGHDGAGGGGLGAGGGLFVHAGATVTLKNVSFQNCQAIGGNSGGSYFNTTGGGGMGGNGGQYDGSGGGGFAGNGGGGGFSIGGGGGGGYDGPGGSSVASFDEDYGSGGGGGGVLGFSGGNGAGGFSGGGGGAGDGGNGLDATTLGAGASGGIGSGTGSGGPGGATIATAGGGGGSGAVFNTSGIMGSDGVANTGGSGGSGLIGGGGGGGSTDGTGGNGGDGGSGFGGGGGAGGNGVTQAGNGGNGGFMAGGGGAGKSNVSVAAGDGGFGGGGGGANFSNSNIAGNGGFGGGGGSGGGTNAGNGGFGGGGGGLGSINGYGGFAGGYGGGDRGIGGGGGALGGAIFIQEGGNLIIDTAISFLGNSITAGTGQNNGEAYGIDIFMMSGSNVTVQNLTVNSTVPNPIESNIGEGGGDPNVGGLTLGSGNTAVFTLNGANTYTGSTVVNSGILNFNGNGSVITPVILSGGALSGNGSLLINGAITNTGNLTVNNGTVAPGGYSYGKIFVGNNLQFTGGQFLTEFDSLGNADIIDVDGTATLAGTITVDQAIGNFLKGQVITLISAEGGVSGAFTMENLPHMLGGLPIFAVQYTANEVQIRVLKDYVFVKPIIDPGNPRHVVKYILDQLPIDPNSDFGHVVKALGVLTDKELNKTLNMMHPGVFGSLEFMNMTTNAQIMQMFNQKPFRLFTSSEATTMREQELSLTASSDDGSSFYPSIPVRRGCNRNQYSPHHVYFQPFGTWNRQNPKGELRGFNYENAGFLTGYDYFFDQFYVGLSGGYAYTDYRWNGSAGKGHINQAYGGIHGGYFNRFFSVTVATMVGGNFYKTNRNIISSAPNHPNGALDRTAESNSSGLQWTNYLELVGDFSSLSVPLQIFSNITHFYLHNGSFSETGAGSINLRVASKTSNAIRSEVGLGSSCTFEIKGGCLTPYVRISWVNKTLLSNSTYRGGFRGQVGTFSASATSKGTNQWAPGVGIEFANMHGFSLLLNSRAELNRKMKNYSADMRMEYAF